MFHCTLLVVLCMETPRPNPTRAKAQNNCFMHAAATAGAAATALSQSVTLGEPLQKELADLTVLTEQSRMSRDNARPEHHLNMSSGNASDLLLQHLRSYTAQ